MPMGSLSDSPFTLDPEIYSVLLFIQLLWFVSIMFLKQGRI